MWYKVGVRSGPAKCGVFSSLELAHRKGAVILGSRALLRHTVVFSRQRGRRRREEEDGGGEEVQAHYHRWITARKPCFEWYVSFWPDVLSGLLLGHLEWIHSLDPLFAPSVEAVDGDWKTTWSTMVSRTSAPNAEGFSTGCLSVRIHNYLNHVSLRPLSKLTFIYLYIYEDYMTGK